MTKRIDPDAIVATIVFTDDNANIQNIHSGTCSKGHDNVLFITAATMSRLNSAVFHYLLDGDD